MKKYKFITKKLLVQKYRKELKSKSQIAKELACGYGTIDRKLKRYNIIIRTLSEAQKNIKHKLKYNISKKFLIKEYIKNEKSVNQIAKEVGCSYRTIRTNLIKFNIKLRTKSESKKGKRSHLYIDGRMSKKYKCLNCGVRISHSSGLYGEGRCYSCTSKKRWSNKEYKEKTLKASRLGMRVKPNKPEKQLNNILQKLLLKEYKINVKADVMVLGGKIPDFVNVNGQKKIIELYGDYWHSRKITGRTKKQEESIRINHFKKYGYKILIVWEHELKNIEKLTNKLIKFNIE